MTMYISATSYDSWHACNRLWYFKHLLKLEPAREEGPRRFGTMYHAGLEQWWRTMDGGDVPWRDKDQSLVDALRAIRDNARHVQTDPFDVTKAEVMMTAYHARYFELEFETVATPIDRPDESGGVEKWFNLDLLDENGKSVPGWRLTGRKDALKRFSDGRVRPVEHKTTSSKIGPGAPYWSDMSIDTQTSIYVDVAQRLGFKEADRIAYDVSRKPALEPLLATPEEKRTLTKGKGCKTCGGSAGGKRGIVQGSGFVMVEKVVAGKAQQVKEPCPECAVSVNGSVPTPGWSDAPRAPANQRDKDESWQDYAERLTKDIEADPDAYFRMPDVPRTQDQLLDMRADLAVTTGAIGALVALAHERSSDERSVTARRCFPKNSQSCSTMWGRGCDYIHICNGTTPDPFNSQLYRIQKKGA